MTKSSEIMIFALCLKSKTQISHAVFCLFYIHYQQLRSCLDQLRSCLDQKFCSSSHIVLGKPAHLPDYQYLMHILLPLTVKINVLFESEKEEEYFH